MQSSSPFMLQLLATTVSQTLQRPNAAMKLSMNFHHFKI